MLDLSVSGGAQYAALGRRLRVVAAGGLQKEMTRAVNKATRPLGRTVRDQVGQFMPSGYTPTLAAALRIRTQQHPFGVTLKAVAAGKKKKRDIRALEKGLLRHPTFGDRDRWVDQRVRPGFWTVPLRAGGPAVQRQLVQTMQDVAAKLSGG